MEDEAATNGSSAASDEETDRQFSLNSLALVRKAFPRTYISSDDIEEWRRAIYKGVLLENNTQKFWIDESLHKNCFLVLPKACDIAGDDEESCWSWIAKEEKCFPMAVDILVPKSKELSWLSIQGRFKTRVLSPKTTYEVEFVAKVNGPKSLSVWRQLVLPDGTTQLYSGLGATELKKDGTHFYAGKFMMGPETVGTIHFSLSGRLGPEKDRLTLVGVRIHPMD